MAFKTALWLVDGSRLALQDRVVLDSESRLEEWIAHDLSLLGEELLLVGRQVRTPAGPLDLLAIDGDGGLVIAELKRNRTPREVVAQVLDYASWVSGLTVKDVDGLCQQTIRQSLAEGFRDHFAYDLPEGACKTHRMLVVAAELDESSGRIIRYLQEQHEMDINAVFFSVYRPNGQEVLVRAWLADPVETQERAERREQVPWSGMWFVNNGVESNNDRDWELCRAYGFVSAGGAEKYSRPLYKLGLGDLVAVYQTGKGYVGVARVTQLATPADEFVLADGKPLRTVANLRGARNDPSGEHIVGVEWIRTVPESEAKTFRGAFANQNIVCKLRHIPTLDFIRRQFELDGEPTNALDRHEI